MKKAILMMLCCVLAATLWACGDDKKTEKKNSDAGGSRQGAGGDEKNDTGAGGDEKQPPVVVDKKPVVGDAWKAKAPKDVYRLMKKAVSEENHEAFFSLYTDKALKQMDMMPQLVGGMMKGMLDMMLQMVPEDKRAATRVEQEKKMLKKFGASSFAELLKMSGRDFVTLAMKGDRQGFLKQMEASKLVSVTMGPDGKTATVVLKDHKGKEKPGKVVLVDGGWKLDDFDTGMDKKQPPSVPVDPGK